MEWVAITLTGLAVCLTVTIYVITRAPHMPDDYEHVWLEQRRTKDKKESDNDET